MQSLSHKDLGDDSYFKVTFIQREKVNLSFITVMYIMQAHSHLTKDVSYMWGIICVNIQGDLFDQVLSFKAFALILRFLCL